MTCVLLSQFGPAYAGELSVFEHNGSIIEWFVVGDTIKATYSLPRPGLAKSGVEPGATLFEGAYEGDRIVGKAFAFKSGCAPASYQVIGRHLDNKQTVLDGPAPLRSGCSVTGYSTNSPHAHLVLTFSARHH